MPIRFRCAYCSQLMGIAKRKAGKVVSCPRCHGQVVVPDPGPEESKEDNGAAAPNLFEESDIDKLIGPSALGAGADPGPPPLPPGAPAAVAPSPSGGPPAAPWVPAKEEISFDVERINTPLPPDPPRVGAPGVVLAPTVLVLLGLLIVVLLALAFVGGLLVGKSLGGG